MADLLGFLLSPRRPSGAARDRLRVLYTTHQARRDLTPKQQGLIAEAFCVLFAPGIGDDVIIATTEALEAALEIRNPRPENPPAAINSGIILEFPRA